MPLLLDLTPDDADGQSMLGEVAMTGQVVALSRWGYAYEQVCTLRGRVSTVQCYAFQSPRERLAQIAYLAAAPARYRRRGKLIPWRMHESRARRYLAAYALDATSGIRWLIFT